jgi:hypothetical protein
MRTTSSSSLISSRPRHKSPGRSRVLSTELEARGVAGRRLTESIGTSTRHPQISPVMPLAALNVYSDRVTCFDAERDVSKALEGQAVSRGADAPATGLLVWMFSVDASFVRRLTSVVSSPSSAPARSMLTS